MQSLAELTDSSAQYIEFNGARVSALAREFIAEKHLADHLAQAIDLVRKYFSPSDIRVCVEHDPEIVDMSYLVIEIQVQGSVHDVVRSHRSFAGEAHKMSGAGRELIKLHYNIA